MPNQVNVEEAKLLEKYPYLGYWKIVKTDYVDVDSKHGQRRSLKMVDLSGVSFELKFNKPIMLDHDQASMKLGEKPNWNDDETGVIRWNFPPETAPDIRDIPLFSCYIFNYENTMLKLNGPDLSFYLDFKVTFNKVLEKVDHTTMFLSGCDDIVLTCERLPVLHSYDAHFTFKNMFNSEFLSDCKIKASNGKIYYAHKSVLWLTFKEKTDILLNRFHVYSTDAEVIEVILYYAYAACLPHDKKETKGLIRPPLPVLISKPEQMKMLNEFVQNFSELEKLKSLVDAYAKSQEFKTKTNMLINEIKVCFQNVNDYFKCDSKAQKEAGLFGKPLELVQTIRKSIDQLLLAFLKLLRMSDSFASALDYLPLNDQYEFISTISNCFHFFIIEGKSFFGSLVEQMKHLDDKQKESLAEQIIHECNMISTVVLGMFKDINASFELILKESRKVLDDAKQISLLEYLVADKEVGIFEKSKDEIKIAIRDLESKLQSFQMMNDEAKDNFGKLMMKEAVTEICGILTQFIETKLVPFEQLQTFNQHFQEYLNTNDFAFDFFLILFKFKWVLEKSKLNKANIVPFLHEFTSHLPSRSELNNHLASLGLDASPNNESQFVTTIPCNIDSFFVSSLTHASHLAAASKVLQGNTEYHNITVELKSSSTKNIGVNDAIVGSRSAWFNKELKHISLDRKITVNETDSESFETFIQYLYTGSLNEPKLDDKQALERLKKIATKYECAPLKTLIDLKIQQL